MYDRSIRTNTGNGGETEADEICLLAEKETFSDKHARFVWVFVGHMGAWSRGATL